MELKLVELKDIQKVVEELKDHLTKLINCQFEALRADLVAAPPEKEWYSTAEYAELIGVKPETVRKNYIERSRIDATKDPESRQWLIPHSEILKARQLPRATKG